MSRPARISSDTPIPFDGLNIAAFEAADVDPESFSHEAHVYIAWSYLQETDLQQAIQRYSAALRRLTLKLGVPGKYHETLTWFFMILIAERCRLKTCSDWPTFKAANPDLLTNAKGLVSTYYTPACLGSTMAREQFLLPDRVRDAHGAAMI